MPLRRQNEKKFLSELCKPVLTNRRRRMRAAHVFSVGSFRAQHRQLQKVLLLSFRCLARAVTVESFSGGANSVCLCCCCMRFAEKQSSPPSLADVICLQDLLFLSRLYFFPHRREEILLLPSGTCSCTLCNHVQQSVPLSLCLTRACTSKKGVELLSTSLPCALLQQESRFCLLSLPQQSLLLRRHSNACTCLLSLSFSLSSYFSEKKDLNRVDGASSG